MYIYGLALHTVSDMFAHSAYLIKDGKPTRIYHTTMDDDPKNEAEIGRASCRERVSSRV